MRAIIFARCHGSSDPAQSILMRWIRRKSAAVKHKFASPPPRHELVSGLDDFELARMIRERLYEDKEYARVRRRQWRGLASVTRLGSLALSAAGTIVLGVAELGRLATIGFICSALVTTLGAIEPFFNWRSRWILAEEALAQWHQIEEGLALYVAQNPAKDLDRDIILNFDRERRAVWSHFSTQWLRERRVDRPQN